MRAAKNQDFIATPFQKTVNYGNYRLKHPDISNVQKLHNCTNNNLNF